MKTLLLLVLVACGGHAAPERATTTGSASDAKPRLDLHCTPQPGFDEAACSAKGNGCAYGPPLICRGVDVDDKTHERERKVYEAGTQPCQCICEDERTRCMMVP